MAKTTLRQRLGYNTPHYPKFYKLGINSSKLELRLRLVLANDSFNWSVSRILYPSGIPELRRSFIYAPVLRDCTGQGLPSTSRSPAKPVVSYTTFAN